MNNKKIKKILKQSFINNMSPLMLEKIKNDLNDVKQYAPLKDTTMSKENENKHKVSSLFSKFVFGGAMCAIFAIGLTLGNLFPATRLVSGQETTIYLDVNPSIEIQVDKNEKVIKCISNNKEAEVILENLSLRGVEVDTALYAIVGSMYTNGYLNSETNSILLSVDSNQDNEKSLLDILTQEINTVFENNKDMECSIIGQKVDVNSEIREKAETNQVSIGKMHLIDKIIENSDLYTNTNEYELCRMSVHELDIIYHSLDEQIKEGDVVSGNPNGFINKSEALDYVVEQLEAFKYEIDAYEIMTIYHYDINLNPHMVYFISIQIEDNKDKQYFIVDCSSGELLPQDIIQDWVEKLYYSK